MRRILGGAVLVALSTGYALAGGVERSSQSVGILFEEGRYAEISYGFFDPGVSGSIGGGASPSGEMSPAYSSFSLGYKQALSDRLAFALIVDEPIGADVDYPSNGYPLQGTTAKLEALAVTGLVKYNIDETYSVYGGLRVQQAKGTVNIPGFFYSLDTDRQTDIGYVLGVAWEKPEIAARVAFTYNSAITHSFNSVENGTNFDTFETEVPQSVNLEFQTGIASDTLLFGSVRWVDWTEFTINPPDWALSRPAPLVSYQSDRVTYNLGIGRRFNDQWSGALTVGHEPSNGDQTGNLGPTDGFTSVGVAATYTHDTIKVTTGVRYVDIGDATTQAPLLADFSGNYGIGVGVRVGFSF